jgi:hypothetical protein
MFSMARQWDAVRFRTEKSLFSGRFAAKFFLRGAANRTLTNGRQKGVSGHVF